MLCIIILGGFMTIKVNVRITNEHFVEAQNEEEARRIIAEYYSNNRRNEQWTITKLSEVTLKCTSLAKMTTTTS